MTSEMINKLVDQAKREHDHATEIFLQWFVTEQIEEEENAGDLLGKMKLIGNDPNALLTMDSQLSARVFTPPMSAEIMAGKAGLDSTSEDDPGGTSKADKGSAPEPGDSAIPKQLVDQAVERLIREKFSEKIEGMMTEAIEKVVLKEISRLKTSLMEDADDNEL